MNTIIFEKLTIDEQKPVRGGGDISYITCPEPDPITSKPFDHCVP